MMILWIIGYIVVGVLVTAVLVSTAPKQNTTFQTEFWATLILFLFWPVGLFVRLLAKLLG